MDQITRNNDGNQGCANKFTLNWQKIESFLKIQSNNIFNIFRRDKLLAKKSV